MIIDRRAPYRRLSVLPSSVRPCVHVTESLSHDERKREMRGHIGEVMWYTIPDERGGVTESMNSEHQPSLNCLFEDDQSCCWNVNVPGGSPKL